MCTRTRLQAQQSEPRLLPICKLASLLKIKTIYLPRYGPVAYLGIQIKYPHSNGHVPVIDKL